jgi:hypothetical protein
MQKYFREKSNLKPLPFNKALFGMDNSNIPWIEKRDM